MGQKTSDTGGSSPKGKGPKDQTQQAKAELLTRAEVEKILKAETDRLTTELRKDTEAQVGNVRSQLMKAQDAREKEWEARDRAHKQQIHDLNTKDMDETARNAYEATMFRERAEELDQRNQALAQELAQQQGMTNYVQGMTQQLGIDIADLDMSDPDALATSGWAAAQKMIGDLQGKVKELEDGKKEEPTPEKKPVAAPKVVSPPSVVTDVPSQSAPPVTLVDLRKSLSERLGLKETMSEEKFFEYAERPDESGVDLNEMLPALAAGAETSEEEE